MRLIPKISVKTMFLKWHYFAGHVRFAGSNLVRHAKWGRRILVFCRIHGASVGKFRLRSRWHQTPGTERNFETFDVLTRPRLFLKHKSFWYCFQLTLLIELLKTLDPEFYSYLDAKDSGNLFFCFRWLLIWFKREFAFTEVMGLWEVLWTDLPCQNFHLVGKKF